MSDTKPSKPLFITKDGVEMFEDGKVWMLDGMLDIYELDHYPKNDDGIGMYRNYFSSKEAAEDYKIMNYANLPIKEIMKLYMEVYGTEGVEFLAKLKSKALKRIRNEE
jgi:hypothetical protein